MSKQIYINLITKDLSKATEFYSQIGFVKNEMYSDDKASAMMWDENIVFMLLSEDFAKIFSDGKELANQKKTVSAFYSLSFDSKSEVDDFCEKVKNAGGRVYQNAYNQEFASDFMYTFEVEDLDGYIIEPVYMSMPFKDI